MRLQGHPFTGSRTRRVGRLSKRGFSVKSDALGSLEALTTSLEASKIPVRLADVGDVSRRDVVKAKAVHVKDQYLGVVLAFGVKLLPDAEEEIALSKIPVFKGDVLYH